MTAGGRSNILDPARRETAWNADGMHSHASTDWYWRQKVTKHGKHHKETNLLSLNTWCGYSACRCCTHQEASRTSFLIQSWYRVDWSLRLFPTYFQVMFQPGEFPDSRKSGSIWLMALQQCRHVKHNSADVARIKKHQEDLFWYRDDIERTDRFDFFRRISKSCSSQGSSQTAERAGGFGWWRYSNAGMWDIFRRGFIWPPGCDGKR